MGADAPIPHDPRWPVVSLAEVSTKIGSGATPRGGGESYLPARHRFALVRSQNVFDRRFESDGLAFISDEQAQGLQSVVLQRGDVLLNITGDGVTFGRACIVPDRVLPACVNQHVSIIRADRRRADPGFLLSFLTHPDVKRYIESFNAGGSRRAITKGHIESFRIPLPPLPEQHAIAGILGTLDRKIDLNGRTNETLEAIARALFKSWFVDFDPVRAKIVGRQPVGMDLGTSNLFPSTLQDSEGGEIPAGWTRAPLGEFASALSGGTPSKQNAALWGGALPWISPKVMTAIHADEPDAWVTPAAVGNGTRTAPPGSTLVMVRGMGLHERVRVSQARSEVTFNQDVKALVPKAIEPTLLLFALLHGQPELLGRVESSGHGTGKLPTEILLNYSVTMPPLGIQRRLVPVFDALNDKIATSREEGRALTATRDALLPRLLSGELRSREADRMVEATT